MSLIIPPSSLLARRTSSWWRRSSAMKMALAAFVGGALFAGLVIKRPGAVSFTTQATDAAHSTAASRAPQVPVTTAANTKADPNVGQMRTASAKPAAQDCTQAWPYGKDCAETAKSKPSAAPVKASEPSKPAPATAAAPAEPAKTREAAKPAEPVRVITPDRTAPVREAAAPPPEPKAPEFKASEPQLAQSAGPAVAVNTAPNASTVPAAKPASGPAATFAASGATVAEVASEAPRASAEAPPLPRARPAPVVAQDTQGRAAPEQAPEVSPSSAGAPAPTGDMRKQRTKTASVAEPKPAPEPNVAPLEPKSTSQPKPATRSAAEVREPTAESRPRRRVETVRSAAREPRTESRPESYAARRERVEPSSSLRDRQEADGFSMVRAYRLPDGRRVTVFRRVLDEPETPRYRTYRPTFGFSERGLAYSEW